MPTLAAELQLDLVQPDGATEPLTVRVHVPVASDRAWECRIEFVGPVAGMRPGGMRIYGEDSWQALTLALCTVRVNLENCLPAGVRIRWCEGIVTVAELFNDRSRQEGEDRQ